MATNRTPQRPRTRRIPVASSAKRIRIFAAFVAALTLLGAGRALQLQAFDPQAYAAQAEAKMKSTVPLLPVRGSITDRNGVVLAQSQPAVKVIADPDMIRTNGAPKPDAMSAKEKEKAAQAPAAIAELLAKHLGGKASDYLAKLTVDASKYQVVQRQVQAYTYQQLIAEVREGSWNGIHSEPDPIRTYPAGSLAANVVGFVNADGEGKGGLEYVANTALAGVPGTQTMDVARYGRIPLGTNVLTPAKDGASYELTLDGELQLMAEKALAAGVQNAGAATGTVVVTNIKTGEVLAMANVPTFDPSDPGAAKNKDLGNRAITDAYEPGSVQKVLTMAALVDSGTATPDTRLTIPAQIRSGAGYIKDAWTHGTLYLTARGMVAMSSNIGAVQLGRQLDKSTFSTYLKNFGLGSPSGIGLPGEASGSVPGADMADYTRDQISFGAGLSVTAIQMASAVGGIVNGGVYHRPVIVKSAKNADGTTVELPQPESRRVISEESSKMVLDSMESVITGGGGKALAIDGFRTAGKTGTAMRYNAACGCYNGYTSSFVGVAPADDPQLLVYVVIDQPTKGHFGSAVAGPVYQEIMSVALARYGVLPSTSKPANGVIEYQK